MRPKFCLLVAVSTLAWAAPALAAPGDPVTIGEGVTLDPIIAARVRYEGVDAANFPNGADALTIRVRAGAELKASGFSVLVEAESTLGLINDYNDTLPGNGVEPFPTVAECR